MAKDKDKDKKKNDNGGINGTPSGSKDKDKDKKDKDKKSGGGDTKDTRIFEVGGSPPGTVATGADKYAATWDQLNAPKIPSDQLVAAGLPAPVGKTAPTGPKGTYGGTNGVPADMINPVTGGLIVHATPLGDPKGVLADKAKEDDKKKYSDDPVLAFQQKEADKAREEEKKRKERIEEGMDKIDDAFGGFNDAFYGQREQDFKDYYMNQLTPQFDKARENLTYTLAKAGLGTTYGTAGSTVEAERKAQNESDIANQTAQVSANAASDRSKTEAQIAAEKTALINTLNSTADAEAIGNEATAKQTQLNNLAPDYQPLGDIFFGAAQGIGGLAQSVQNTAFTNTFNGVGRNNGTRTGGTTIY